MTTPPTPRRWHLVLVLGACGVLLTWWALSMRPKLRLQVRLASLAETADAATPKAPSVLYVSLGADKQHVSRPTWGSSYDFSFTPPRGGLGATIDVDLHTNDRETIAGSVSVSPGIKVVVLISQPGDFAVQP